MSLKYHYTENDLLAGEPYHYHYTLYEGVSLLQAYLENRKKTLARLDKQMKSRSGNDIEAAALDTRSAGEDEPPPFSGVLVRPVNTVKELLAASRWVARGGDIRHPELLMFVDSLTKKFEVAKRLRSNYAVGLRVDVKDSAPVDAYCYLAFLIACRDSPEDLLWRLNALLKLNDLIISTDIRNLSSDAIRPEIQAMRFELEQVSRLAREKQVSIW